MRNKPTYHVWPTNALDDHSADIEVIIDDRLTDPATFDRAKRRYDLVRSLFGDDFGYIPHRVSEKL